jgi:membrane protein implicated in regulation of membrane protease activity
MKIKNILYAILFILLVVVVLVSDLFCAAAAAAIGLPVILSIAYTWWWMLSYLCYGVVLYIVYRIVKENKNNEKIYHPQ